MWEPHVKPEPVTFDEQPETEVQLTPEHFAALGEAYAAVLEWVTNADPNKSDYDETIKNRTIAMVWVLKPELFGNRNLHKLVDLPGIHASAKTICKHAKNFTKTFGIRSPMQYKDHTKPEKRKPSDQAEFDF